MNQKSECIKYNRKSTKWPGVWGNSKTDGKHAGKHAAEKILELLYFFHDN